MHDQHFDDLAIRFAKKIYGSNKGTIRLAVLQADLTEVLPQRPLQVLDIGAGLGHMSLWLAQQGHHVTLVEPALSMLETAQNSFANAQCQATFIQADWQTFTQQNQQQYDLVLCHAVLEWLAETKTILSALQQLTAADGWLSLAFYNKDGLILQNLIKGNLRKLNQQRFTGDAGGLTPQQPLDPRELADQVEPLWYIRQRSGIRVFHDYMPPQFRQKIAPEELVNTELNYRRHPALSGLGRYLHWLCQPRTSTVD
ncbi:methyltransferase domain-containing protein [Denitrificimonas sp. JX-1]|uniref:tRNA 5-carboxymethoxyuridine methyltransferase n=1 Tax=Denitrificimonas halotolerans TaxID=3098930 RepID=A0ABU5GQG7_9GAMM|nr:methyltransferase domain-containing protein [Denitrificimonas sp. JX-1]MDY7219234.1 methyltransferase domain-containing protein [Denitrificimonas sp. JX-1]